MAVDVVFSVKPDADYVSVSDDDFQAMLAAGMIDRYRTATGIRSAGGTTVPAAAAPRIDAPTTIEVRFSILAEAGYVTVQRQDLQVLIDGGLLISYRDNGQVVTIAGSGGAAFATAGAANGTGRLSANVTTNANGSTGYTTAGTATGAGQATATAYSTSRQTAAGTVTGTGTLAGVSALGLTPQGKGEQGGKGNGGKGGTGDTTAATIGRGTLSATVTATPTTVPSGYTTAGTAAGVGTVSGTVAGGAGGPVAAVDSAVVDTSAVG